MYFALLAAGWNLLAGYTGQFSMAPACFAMIGAYTTGLLAYHLKIAPSLGIPASILAAGAIGAILGIVVLRLRGPYLALTTLSFAEIMRLAIGNSYDFTRGDLGLNVPGLLESRLAYYYAFVAMLREAGGIQLIVFALLVILIARFFREGLWGLARRLLRKITA